MNAFLANVQLYYAHYTYQRAPNLLAWRARLRARFQTHVRTAAHRTALPWTETRPKAVTAEWVAGPR